MASSLIRGLLSKDMDKLQVTVSDVNQTQLFAFEKTLGIQTSLNNRIAVAKASVVVLAVKPQIVKAVVTEIRDILIENKALIISVAAGVRVHDIQSWIEDDQPIVRCIPNTPALVGAGASGLYANRAATKQQCLFADTLLQAVGITAWVDEETMLDAITALSGSGPAYFFLLIETMTDAGVKLGLERQLAEQLAGQTAYGAAKMLHETTKPAIKLKQNVTSKGGTTEAALNNFCTADLSNIVYESMLCAYKRSIEIGTQLGGEEEC